MRFLIDANLPPALATWLCDQGAAAEHVTALGLARATDRELWNYAKANGAVLISKDEDFLLLRQADPEGPKVIWVRFGNATRSQVLRRFASTWGAITQALTHDPIVEIK